MGFIITVVTSLIHVLIYIHFLFQKMHLLFEYYGMCNRLVSCQYFYYYIFDMHHSQNKPDYLEDVDSARFSTLFSLTLNIYIHKSMFEYYLYKALIPY